MVERRLTAWLRPVLALRSDRHLDVGDPTKAVLLTAPDRFRAVDVHILEHGDARSP